MTTHPVRKALAPAAAIALLLGAAAPVAAASPGTRTPTPDHFSTTIDNPFLPFAPGTVMRYRESGGGGGGTEIVRVTHRTKTVQGVETVVVRDRAYAAGELVEDTRDWYAQDRRGNVWYFGENTKEYDHGTVVSTKGSWKAGRKGARAGILMKARPRVGDTYYEEFESGVAEDQATVLRRDASVTVPYGSFTRVLTTKNFTALEPAKVERKFYARGVGSVLEKLVKGGHERLVLVSMVRP